MAILVAVLAFGLAGLCILAHIARDFVHARRYREIVRLSKEVPPVAAGPQWQNILKRGQQLIM